LVQEENVATEEYVISRLAGRSFEDEFGGTIDSDLALLQVAIVAVVLYTVIALSDCKDAWVGRRATLTWAGVRPRISASLHLCVSASLHLCVSASLCRCIPASLHPCVSASLLTLPRAQSVCR
jgi:hypothetical protein